LKPKKEGGDKKWEYHDEFMVSTGDYYKDCFTSATTHLYTRDYEINGNYSKITGTIFRSYLSRDVEPGFLNYCYFYIWGDGKLLYESENMLKPFLPTFLEIDISGVEIIKLGFGHEEYSRFATAIIGISDVTLYR
jgi:hypothetical protein